MRKIRKRIFAAVLAAALLFTMPGMASYAEAEGTQTEDISESVAVLAEYDAAEETEAENEVIQEPEIEDSDTDKSGTGEDDAGDADAQEPAEEETVPTQKEDTEECICGMLCTEDSINEDCPVCGTENADLSRCKGEKTENSSEKDSEYEDADLSRCKGEKTEAPKRTQESMAEEKIITTWEWIDPEEYLTDGVLALPGASRRNPAFLADVTALLPEKIRAEVETVNVTEDGEETETSSEALSEAEEMEITLTGWKCVGYPEDGAYEGVYTFYASLPEGFVLAEDAAALRVKVELGGAKMLDGEVSADYQEASWDGNAVTYTPQTAENCTPVAESTEAVTWNAGWYVVNSTVTISQPITVSGAVNLILADGCTLNADSGIIVTNGNSLTIYAQTGGTGTLNATGMASGGNASAGIGGSTETFDSGTITIHGGNIEATGGSTGTFGIGGAGIGGGTPFSGNGGNSGAIIIFGGTVTAESGEGATTGAGIGGGASRSDGGACSDITIYGGSVKATGSTGGAGIGGGAAGNGNGGAGSNIKICGGDVTATGGDKGAGIGGGGGGASSNSGAGTSITISGGKVTAVGGTNAAGIGGGGGYITALIHSSTIITGGTGTGISIIGGIVDAQGGAGNSSGNYAGDPIGNGGNASGDAGVTKTAGIIFENSEGKVYGTVALDGEYTVKDGYTLSFAEGGKFDGNYAFYQNGSPIEMATVKEQGVAGPATVRECTHTGEGVCKYQPLDGGTSHKKTCLACGMTWEAQPHTDTDHNNQCDDCKTQLVVKLGDVYYDSFDAAWEEANTYDETSTITLLADVTVGSLTLDAGNITIDGGEYILTTEEILVGSSSSLTIASGTIKGKTYAVTLNGGNLEVTGGRIEADGYGIYIYRGTAKLSGGTITGGTYAIIDSSGGKVGNVLLNYGDTNAETHYAFYKDNKSFTLPDTDTLPRGTYTVQECKEPYTYSHTSGTMKHTQFCQYCGDTKAEADCSFTWNDNIGECVCGATLVVDVSDTDLIYDGIAKEPGVTVTLDGTELTAGYTVTCSNNTNAGNNTASVTVSDTNWKYTQKFAIQKAPLTITASDQTITYGGSITQGADNATTAGLCSGDRLDGITLTASTANVPGGNITPSAAGIKNSGGRDVTGNYEITYKDGGLTINKADAEITVGTDTYNKTFGDAAFTLDVTDNNTEADVQYEVKAGVDVISVSNGTVTIKNAGTATVTVSLPETANYNAAASKTITVTVARKGGYTVTEQNRSYLYSRENTGSIDLAALLPKDCGAVTYGTPAASGDVTYSAAPAVNEGILSYTLNSGEINDEGTITVSAATRNYTDISITVKVKLADRIPVSLKTGTEVTLKDNALIYGESLSKLVFNEAEFVGDDGNTVTGTLAWKDAAATPNAGTTSAVWVFTPADTAYISVEGAAAVTVNQAAPTVTETPSVADRVYNPSITLKDGELSGVTVTGVDGKALEGKWSWQSADIVPTVNNSGYVAVFAPKDTTNYETVTRTVTVNVTKATPYIAGLPAAAGITYGDTLNVSALSGGTVLHGDGAGQAGDGAGSAETVAGAFTWKEPSAKPAAADSNVTEYTIVFMPSDTANYNSVEAKVKLTVNKAQNAPNMPGSAMSVSNSVEKAGSVPLPAGWEWQVEDTALEAGAVSAVAVYAGDDTAKPGSSQPGDTKPGMPFIKGEDGKIGWDVIRAEEEQAKEGSVINVDMNGTTVVPGDILDCIRGRDITITFDMGSDIIWSVDGKSVTRNASRDIDFDLKMGVNAIPVDIVNNVAGEGRRIQLSIAHEGEFGFTAVLSINLGKENAGYTASLYYYNQSANKLEYICADEVAEDGTASLAFAHASDYVIAIDGDEEESGIMEPAQPEGSEGTAWNSTTAEESPKAGQGWKPWWFIVAGASAIIMGIGVFFLVRKKKESK